MKISINKATNVVNTMHQEIKNFPEINLSDLYGNRQSLEVSDVLAFIITKLS